MSTEEGFVSCDVQTDSVLSAQEEEVGEAKSKLEIKKWKHFKVNGVEME